jgi:hypothetical protein
MKCSLAVTVGSLVGCILFTASRHESACHLLMTFLLLLLLLQVDAHLSYDAKACYNKAMHLMEMYAARGESSPNCSTIIL